MNVQKLIIESDGEHTQLSIDGILIGRGIRKLEFSTEDINGETNPTIKLLELSVQNFRAKNDSRTCGNKCGYGVTE